MAGTRRMSPEQTGSQGASTVAEQLTLDFATDGSMAPARPQAIDAEPSAQASAVPRGDSGFTVEVVQSARRRTLGVEVHRSLRVVVRVPLGCSDAVVARYVSRQRRWISRQLERFRALPPPRPAPAYESGEQHLFLGRAYCLQLRPERRSQVSLDADTLRVDGIGATSPGATASALARWYQSRARREFAQVLVECHAHPRFAVYPIPDLRIRQMRTRWGSLCPQRGMTLNTVLIQAPRACIEYVVFHELCHLSYRGHGSRFYRLLTAVLPDWEARKRLLETTITW